MIARFVVPSEVFAHTGAKKLLCSTNLRNTVLLINMKRTQTTYVCGGAVILVVGEASTTNTGALPAVSKFSTAFVMS